MTKLQMHYRINEAITAHMTKSTEPIIAIILTKEDKAQFDDEVTITGSKDPEEVKTYMEIPILVRDYTGLLIKHEVPDVIEF